MKKMNFWKTLLGSMMVLAAFTACSDDDTEDGGYKGIPEITVDGGTSTTIAGSLAGGKLEQTVEVVAKGDWELSFENESDATWCTPSPMNGKTGTTQISFTLGQATADRQATLTLTAVGFVEGIPVTKTASILVKQNEGGTTEVTTNVADIRAKLLAMNPKDNESMAVTDELAAMTLTGIVVSDAAGDNVGNQYLVVVQDADRAANSGLTVNATAFKDLALTPGKVLTATMAGATVKGYGGGITLYLGKNTEITAIDGDAPDPIVITSDKIVDYQSQFVKIEQKSQPLSEFAGKAWYTGSYKDGGNGGNVDFETEDGKSFIVRTSQYAVFSKEIVPDKSGYIQGIASVYNSDLQVMPRNAADINLTEDRFTPSVSYTKTTIDQLGKGNYEVEGATIVGVHQKGVMFGQENGGKVSYVLGFENSWTTQTANPYIGEVGKSATVKGECAPRYGLYQFSNFEVTVGSASSLQLPEPETFDAAAIEKYAADIKADEANAAYKYVKLTGVLGISKGSSYNTYTLDVTGLSEVKNITFAYGLDSYYEGLNDGDAVEVTGFALGYDTSSSKLNIMLTDIKADTSTPIVTFTTQPATFAASNPEPQTITYTVANVDASAVKFDKEGTNADKFTIVSNDDKSVVVKANGDNTTSAAYTATLVAKVNGETLASVDLKQAAPASGDGYALISSLADLTAGEYYMAGMIESYNDITYAPYSYHLWVGTVSGSNPAKSNSDLETVNYQYESNQLTLNPNLSDRDKEKGTAAFITLEAVSGKTNTYYIKSGDKYLKSFVEAKNRRMGLADTSEGAEWLFEDNGENGIKISNNGVYLGTAGATYDLLRSYSNESTLKWGVCFFKENK